MKAVIRQKGVEGRWIRGRTKGPGPGRVGPDCFVSWEQTEGFGPVAKKRNIRWQRRA